MAYTKEEFRKLWDANKEGSGITFDDVAECAKEWGLFTCPRTCNITKVLEAVLKAAGCKTR